MVKGLQKDSAPQKMRLKILDWNRKSKNRGLTWGEFITRQPSSIRGITVEKFRGFKNKSYVPIRPVTMFFGPNNGGKSSILKLFASIEQTRITKRSTGSSFTWLPRGVWFDLGMPRQIVNMAHFDGRKTDSHSFKMGIGVEVDDFSRYIKKEKSSDWANFPEEITERDRDFLARFAQGTHVEWTLMLDKNGIGEVSHLSVSRVGENDDMLKFASLYSVGDFAKRVGMSEKQLIGYWKNSVDSVIHGRTLIAIPTDENPREFFEKMSFYLDYCKFAGKVRSDLFEDLERILRSHKIELRDELARFASDSIKRSKSKEFYRAMGRRGARRTNRRGPWHRRGSGLCGPNNGDRAEGADRAFSDFGIDGITLLCHLLTCGSIGETPEDSLERIIKENTSTSDDSIRERGVSDELYEEWRRLTADIGGAEVDWHKIFEEIQSEEIKKAVSRAIEKISKEKKYDSLVTPSEDIELFDSPIQLGSVFGDSFFEFEEQLSEWSDDDQGLGLLKLREKLFDPFLGNPFPRNRCGMVLSQNGLLVNVRTQSNLTNRHTDEDTQNDHLRWASELVARFRSLNSTLNRENIDYLGATRLEPQRYFKVSYQGERRGVSGERAISELAENPELLESTNKKLSSLIGLKIFVEKTQSDYPKRIDTRLYEVRVGKSKNDAILHLPDVGFGISQVLPLLASMGSGNTLVIEEPESNLHPKAQSKLIEEILLSYKSRKNTEGNILMETHSEHFLLRTLQLLEDGVIDDEDVSLIFVDTNDEDGTIAKRVRTRNGVLIDEIPKSFQHLENHTDSMI